MDTITFYDFLPYIILVTLCWLLAYYKIKNGLGLNLIFWIMFIFSAIRYDVGWDFHTYTELIEGKMRTSQIERIEWLSRYLMLMARYSFTQLYFIINSLIGMLCIYSVSKVFSRNAAFSLYIFLTFSLFYLLTMNMIRNFTAILVMMYACQMFLQKKYWRYILFLFIATGFHSSAYIGFLFPVVYFAVFKLKIGMITNLGIFVFSFGVSKMIENVILLFSDNSILGKVAYYVINNSEGSGNLYKYIFYLINLVFIFNWNKLIKVDEMNRLWITLVNVGVCFWVALSFQYTLSLRMALSFIIWIVVLVPSFIEIFSPATRKIAKQGIVLFFTMLFFTNLYLLARAYNAGEIYQASFLPYKVFFFQN